MPGARHRIRSVSGPRWLPVLRGRSPPTENRCPRATMSPGLKNGHFPNPAFRQLLFLRILLTSPQHRFGTREKLTVSNIYIYLSHHELTKSHIRPNTVPVCSDFPQLGDSHQMLRGLKAPETRPCISVGQASGWLGRAELRGCGLCPCLDANTGEGPGRSLAELVAMRPQSTRSPAPSRPAPEQTSVSQPRPVWLRGEGVGHGPEGRRFTSQSRACTSATPPEKGLPEGHVHQEALLD